MIPIVGQIADIRDIVYDIQHFGEHGIKDSLISVGLDTVGFVPGIGDAAKSFKHVDEVSDIVKGAAKHSDDVADVGSIVIKNADSMGTVYKGEKVLAITKIGNNIYKISDDKFIRISTNLSSVTVKNVKLVENFKYIKKSDEALSNMRVAFDYGSAGLNKAGALSYLQKLDTSELKDIGFTDDAISKIFKGELPEKIQSLFIKSLLTDTNVVDSIKAHYKAINMSDADVDKIIQKMSNGVSPPGFQVHHKFPLEDGGSNDFDNFILIDSSSHFVFTGYQVSSSVKGKLDNVGEAIVDWPVPQGKFYSGDLPGLLNDIDTVRLT